MTEKWLPVVGYESLYQVSNLGKIRTIKTGHIKCPTLNKRGNRLYVLLWKENKYKNLKVHRIVLSAFNGQCPQGFEGCHNDGNPLNNSIENLRWDSPKNNQADRIKHGTSNRGERSASAKLTEKQVISILKDNRRQSEIALEYGVQQNTISRIKNGKRWKHLSLSI